LIGSACIGMTIWALVGGFLGYTGIARVGPSPGVEYKASPAMHALLGALVGWLYAPLAGVIVGLIVYSCRCWYRRTK
jgi:hypothetical protein